MILVMNNALSKTDLNTMTANELRVLWARLMKAARAEGMDTEALKSHAINKTVDVPAVSKPIYVTEALIGYIRSAGTVHVKTGRKVWETGFGGDRNLVDEFRADTSRADRVFAAAVS